ncbi:MAG: ATP-binding cassette domain-containing protein [Rhodocyclaceae bacterium]|nr:ATP-binding cassette domain-containing protein [Rhodocyclaceae bacterium]
MSTEQTADGLLRLSALQVLDLIDADFRPDAASTLRLRATLDTLLHKPAIWDRLAAGDALNTQLPCESRHYVLDDVAGLFRHLSGQPGELLLIRRSDEHFHLLTRLTGDEWLALSADGQRHPVGILYKLDGLDAATGVLIRVPQDVRSTLPKSAKSYLRWLITEAWAEVGIASFIVNAGQILLPLFSMLLYNKIINNGVFATLWALAIGMLIYIITDAALRGIRAWAVERLAADLTHRDDLRLWHRLVQPDSQLSTSFAALLSQYRDLSIGREFISATYLLALADIPFLLFYLLVITLIAWPLGLLTIVLAGAYLLFSAEVQRLLTAASRDAEQAMTRKMGLLGSLFSVLDLLKTTPRQQHLRRRWVELGNQASTIEARRRMLQTTANIGMAVIVPFSTVAILVLGAYLIEWQVSNIGALIACSMLASRCLTTVASMFMVLAKWEDFERAAARFEQGLTTPKPLTAARLSLPQPSGRIEVLQLSKNYPERPPVLAQVSLSIAPGEHIAILGKPGAGKTTLLRCMAGLISGDSGRVLFDGADVAEIDFQDRCNWLVFKGQDSAIFAGSLADNLQAENPQLLQQALWISGLDQEVQAGRLTLGTLLHDYGTNLSGGQRQKVALARAFARSGQIYLLDEPSAGLDPESERQFAQRLKQGVSGATVLMITHSPHLIETVGRLVVLDNGHVVADGPREKLLQQTPAVSAPTN